MLFAAAMTTVELLDEAYEQLHETGPEFEGWLSNHGPMAVDALLRLGHSGEVRPWLTSYARRLHQLPEPRWELAEEEWRDVLGDASRLGDWLALFARLVHDEPWEQLIVRWWPRLLPGSVASAAHGLIRTGHTVRALREQVTEPRLDELGQALGYWAARWQPVPGYRRPGGDLPVHATLDALPRVDASGGIRARLACLGRVPAWPTALAALSPVAEPNVVPQALDGLVDAAVTRYALWASGSPVMLVHAATAPRAMALVLPVLPQHLWIPSYEVAWAVTAAISSAYRPEQELPTQLDRQPGTQTEDLCAQAVEGGDEHAIKFAEVARESHQRGNLSALGALSTAIRLIGNEDD
jgi:hypothetical protein